MSKRYLLKIAMLLAIAISLSGCEKFLEEDMKSSASASNFYETEGEAQAAVNGVYAILYNIFSDSNFFTAVEGSTDLLTMRSTNNIDGSFGYSPVTPGVGTMVWKYGYQGVMQANNTISGIKNSKLSEATKNKLIAEAVVLRSLYYFILTNTFSDIPFWTEGLQTEDQVNKVIALPRTDADIVRDSLMADLQHYAPYLLEKADGSNTGRATQGFAYGLTGRIALTNRNWEKARWAAEQVINLAESKHIYQLMPDFGDVYKTKNNAESIFEIQYSYSVTGLQRSHAIYNWCMPSGKNGSVYNGVNMVDSTATTYGSMRPTLRLENYYANTDKRKQHILASGFNGQQFTLFKNNGRYWLGPKYWDFKANNLASGRNIIFMRYADVLLVMAEALIELDELGDAKFYIDKIRQRADIGTLPLTNQATMREELRKERARELVGEYSRKWDIVRWGIFYESIKSIGSEYAPPVENVKPYHLYYPIPYIEMVKNPTIKQNPGY